MGRRGPQPTPTLKLKLRGSRAGDARAKLGAEPKPVGGLKAAPAYLSPAAKAEWRRQLKAIPDLFTSADRAAFIGYCKTWGMLEDDMTGKAVLEEAREERLWERLRKYSNMFGFNPAARASVKVAPKRTEKNATAKWFDKKTS